MCEPLTDQERLAVNTVCGRALDEWERAGRPIDVAALAAIMVAAAARAVKLVREKQVPKGAA